MKGIAKKYVVVALFFLFATNLFAPGSNCLVIIGQPPANPFRSLIHAVGMVETSHDTLAYNAEEQAVGYFQIRPVRVNDYNKRTGSNLTLNDMYKYEIAEKVFLYYASQVGPADFERIAKSWNGSGPLTITYWSKVKKFL